MLQLAAVGVAMSNAKPKAKEAADIIIQVPRFPFDFVEEVGCMSDGFPSVDK